MTEATAAGAQPATRNPQPSTVFRETFATRLGAILSMIGVAVGLGNVWRFPYMVGQFGGAAFVAFYLFVVVVIGIPALTAEWALGRETRRGTLGAFARGGLPFGRAVGWILFAVVAAATAYYTNVVGWVLWHALSGLASAGRITLDAAAILPPPAGVDARSLLLQLGCTAFVLLACVAVLLRGLRRGIERASLVVMPLLLIILLALVARALTLPGAGEGLQWFILKFDVADLSPRVMVAAVGQAVFSLSLGGTFMVVYGSYLREGETLPRNAAWTAAGDTTAGLLAGLAIFPAVFALGLEPAAGPGLVFSTLPEVFARIPAGWLFGLLFFLGLAGAAFLSDIAALEVLIAGLTDNTRLSRQRATWFMAALVLMLAVPPMLSLRVFVPWDLSFGSGMQTFGALVAVLTIGWAMDRGRALRALNAPRWLYLWVRWVIPAAIVLVGLWWLATEVLHLAASP